MARPKHVGSADVIAGIAGRTEGTKHEQIRDALLEFISGSKPGQLLPSERVLSERLSAARMTVRQSIVDLERDGYVRRVPGKGTYIQNPRVAHSGVFRSFSQDMELRGLVPSSLSTTTTSVRCTARMAEKLEIDVGTTVLHIERVRAADGVPMAIERTNVPQDRYPGLAEALQRGDSLYALLQQRYDIRLESAEQHISIASLTAAEAAQLAVEPGTPAFLIDRVTRDHRGLVIEQGESLYRGDRYEIHMHVGAERR